MHQPQAEYHGVDIPLHSFRDPIPLAVMIADLGRDAN